MIAINLSKQQALDTDQKQYTANQFYFNYKSSKTNSNVFHC